MATLYGRKLCCDLIQTHFGELVQVFLDLWLQLELRFHVLVQYSRLGLWVWELGFRFSCCLCGGRKSRGQFGFVPANMLCDFGELQKVAKCLVYRGPLALQDIARFSELNPTTLKCSILVLVQHSCVQAFKVEHEGEMKSQPTTFFPRQGALE